MTSETNAIAELTPGPATVPATAPPQAVAAQVEAQTNTPPVKVVLGEVPTSTPVSAGIPEEGTVAVTYDPTGDVGLDYALGFVGRLGFGPQHPAMAAAMTGNMSLLRAELAQLGDKALGANEVVGLAEEAYKRLAAQQAESDKALSTYAVTAAGGQESWAQVQAWASGAADPSEKAAINAQLAAGGVQAKMAVDYLVKCYAKSSGATKEPGKVASSNASPGGVSTGNSPLTASRYSAAVQALTRASGGRDPAGSPAYAALQSRRLAGRKQGI